MLTVLRQNRGREYIYIPYLCLVSGEQSVGGGGKVWFKFDLLNCTKNSYQYEIHRICNSRNYDAPPLASRLRWEGRVFVPTQ